MLSWLDLVILLLILVMRTLQVYNDVVAFFFIAVFYSLYRSKRTKENRKLYIDMYNNFYL